MGFTVRSALTWALDLLKNVSPGPTPGEQIPSYPLLDSEVLLAHILGKTREFLHTHPDHPVSDREMDEFRRAVTRRQKNEPVAYITGVREFWSLPFRVRPGVLIPRPETEILVQAVLDRWKAFGPDDPRILDVGTGSGNIAVSLAVEIPRAKILATDVSPAALGAALQNALAQNLSGRVRFVRASLFDGISPGNSPFDFIVSNPPYVPESEWGLCSPEVREYEPKEALFVPGSGTRFHGELIRGTPSFLRKNGCLFLEIGIGQAEEVAGMFRSRPEFGEPEIRSDYAGIPRVVFAERT